MNCISAGNRTNQLCRARLTVGGIVQGVGFRPYVYGLAKTHGLVGFVRNLGGKLQLEIQGLPDKVDLFIEELIVKAPPLASVKELHCEIRPTKSEEKDFTILPSRVNDDDWQLVPADSATCSQCLHELFDKNDRRFHYPFINCVNCGPRFTVINDLPYDRQSTTMSEFKMCDQCMQEYENPLSRRFHAQPNACANCGPTLTFISKSGGKYIEEKNQQAIIKMVLENLLDGKIIAIKGLGGFHLACDATNKLAVHNLRKGKNRMDKPFAVMMQDCAMAQKYCLLSMEDEQLLSSRKAPIVLLEKLPLERLPVGKLPVEKIWGEKLPVEKLRLDKLPDCKIADNVAPGNYLLGVMLPYTPLHHILASGFAKPLIMTSANLSEEPIVIENQEALQELASIADCFVLHNRNIAARYDDSVVRVTAATPSIIRRSRGYAPEPIELACAVAKPILALGGHLKNTFCFLKENQAFISPHIADLDNIKSIDHFENTLKKYRQLFRLKEELIACDMHPDYYSTTLAEDLAKNLTKNLTKNLPENKQLPLIKAQHHHAHVVSCMAEHQLKGPAIGIAFDGTGYGTDGTIWGGEFLIAYPECFERFACLEPVIMPGAQQSIRSPWRMALAYIDNQDEADRILFKDYIASLRNLIGAAKIDIVDQQIVRRFNSPLTSSCGRLFDAVSSILGICHEACYEGQAAIELEAIAMQDKSNAPTTTYPYEIVQDAVVQLGSNHDSIQHVITKDITKHIVQASNRDFIQHVITKDIIKHIVQDKINGVEIKTIARKFHHTLAGIISDLCCRARIKYSINNICLSGGVFQNRLLLEASIAALEAEKFSVYFPQKLPANDGGISLGQAIIAAAQSGNLVW